MNQAPTKGAGAWPGGGVGCVPDTGGVRKLGTSRRVGILETEEVAGTGSTSTVGEDGRVRIRAREEQEVPPTTDLGVEPGTARRRVRGGDRGRERPRARSRVSDRTGSRRGFDPDGRVTRTDETRPN